MSALNPSNQQSDSNPTVISLFEFSGETLEEKEVVQIGECIEYLRSSTNTWINVDGLKDSKLLKQLGDCFDIHPLVLEDICETNHRPIVEEFENYFFVLLKMITYDLTLKSIKVEQVSLIFGNNFLVSFQEDVGDVFDHVRLRLRKARGRIRTSGADFLAYALIDAIVDSYFEVLEAIGDQIELIEEQVVAVPSPATFKRIHTIKRELIFLRKAVWPLRECINVLLRSESPLIAPETKVYLRDLYDQVVQVMDSIETARDFLTGMLDVYLSSASNKMNEIMKVLTIMTSIFIPLSFIAGVYGMNFEYMPELHSVWGYPIVMVVMAAIAVGLLFWFHKKKWI